MPCSARPSAGPRVRAGGEPGPASTRSGHRAATCAERGGCVSAPPNGPRSDGFVLAVDGGNAKTDLALLDSGGALLSFARGGGSSAHNLGVEGSIGVLEGLLTDAIGRAGLGSFEGPLASAAYLLLAGADLPEERSALQARIGELHWSHRLVVDNDTLALLRAGTDRGWG